MADRAAGSGGGLLGIVVAGIILVLMGVPFVGMAVMTAMLVGRTAGQGLPLALGTLALVYLISGFNGALIAATGSGAMAGTILTGRNFRSSVTIASGATAVAAIFVTLLLPEGSFLSSDNLETLARMYGSAGISGSEIALAMELLVYILPALMALWAATGVIAAGAAARMICMRGGTWPDTGEGEPVRLGLLPAWILIVALAANLAGGLPPEVKRASVNVSMFMALPYSVVGLSVLRRLLALYPRSLFLALLVGILFPPAAAGLLIITGILDTWIDFRALMERSKERKNQ
ncbi:MAG: hypothetical protein R6U39_06350 [Candidatus Aegiribacteria sp.]